MPRPPTLSGIKEFVKSLESGPYLAVCICLDPDVEQPGIAPELLRHPDEEDEEEKPPKKQSYWKKKKAVPIGQILLRPCWSKEMSHHRNAVIGVDVLREYQGRGYGTEAVAWMLDYAFEAVNMHSVRLNCLSWNNRAAKSYQKVGFQSAGVSREAVWAMGRWWDELHFDILEDEWKKDRERVWSEVVRRGKKQ